MKILKYTLSLMIIIILNNQTRAQGVRDTLYFVTDLRDPRLLKYNDSLYAYKMGLAYLEKAITFFNEFADSNCNVPEQNIEPYYWKISFGNKTGLHWIHIESYPMRVTTYNDSIKYSIRGIKPVCKVLMLYNQSGRSRFADSKEIFPYYKEPIKRVRYLAPLGSINVSGREILYYTEYEREKLLQRLSDGDIVFTKTRENVYTASRCCKETTYWLSNVLFKKYYGEVINLNNYELAH